MQPYQGLINLYSAKIKELQKQNNFISFCRIASFLAILGTGYLFLKSNNWFYLFITIIFINAFFFLLIKDSKIKWQKDYNKQLKQINVDELAFISNGINNYKDGNEFANISHFYAYDLDIFGQKSLFQYLNRTATYMGENSLANSLLNNLSKTEIEENQLAIEELNTNITFRQQINALAKLANDSKEKHKKILQWCNSKEIEFSNFHKFLMYFLPIVFIVAVCIANFTNYPNFEKLSLFIFIANNYYAFSFFKKIKNEVDQSDKINETINSYGLILKGIENEKFISSKLQKLQTILTENKSKASSEILKFSKIIASLESMQNPLGASIVNGTFLYHLHKLKIFGEWKKNNATNVGNWLQVIGEIEKLNSLANFAFNNPKYCFPTINENKLINFTQLGHPLINEQKRICNDIEFKENNFIILTGSNMSGKSTFLRTLGINMVLGGIGSVICCNKATIMPLPILVSMRLNDSLSDSESYFFSEVKRLQLIMQKIEKEYCFVLLDEILRGTNSDDKHIGTIGVIKKIVEKKAIGIIATHDIDVCKLADEDATILTNKCFEVEIVNNELLFDYKLKDGICKNKSATFLLKKMNVI